MKSVIITVAGTATRFNKDTSEDTLKCIYYEGNPKHTLLAEILRKSCGCDEFIIVGGYLYEKLKSYIAQYLSEYKDRIKLVYNPEFSTFGSGYSLILGIQNVSEEAEEVIFVEGDLYFDKDSYERVIESDCNILTVNHELIRADKAVALYTDLEGRLHYLYDLTHLSLSIGEPFTAIYNSGQVWKFTDTDMLRNGVKSLTTAQVKGTNLEIIQGYFGNLSADQYKIIPFENWYNCNTVADYRKVNKEIQK